MGIGSVAAAFLTAVLLTSFVAQAQERGANLRVEALRLRDTGHFAEAAAALRGHLVSYPDDGDAIRLLAETLYWLNDLRGATEVSEKGLQLHPGDNALRLQYAGMLVQIGRYNRAREVLAPVVRDDLLGFRARALLDTLSSWQHSEGRPWSRIAPAFRHDDQPLNRVDVAGELGFYLTPAARIMFRADAIRFSLQASASRSAETAELGVRFAAASNPVRFEAGAGLVQRSFGGSAGSPQPNRSSSDVIGSAELGVRVQPHLVLRARGERTPYFYTEASLSQPVMTNSGGLYLDLEETHGWQGQVAAQMQQYPDDNKVMTGYVWVLGPIMRSEGALVQIGYSGASQNADESRFVLQRPVQPYSPSDARFDFSGQYVPYYTPVNMLSHSVLAALVLHSAGGAVFRASGSYGVRATENVATFSAGTGTPAQRNTVVGTIGNRTFNPWSGQAHLEFPQSGHVKLALSADLARTAFYTVSGVAASLTWTF